MATYHVTGPDGHTYEVTGPDGASDADVLAQVQAYHAPQAPKQGADYAGTAEADSNTENLMAGMGGALAGIPLGLRQMMGKAKPEEVQQWKDSMAGLWTTPMGKVGQVAGAALPAIPAMMIPGVNTVAGAAALGAAQGAVQPVGQGESRLTNTALGGVLGGAGQGLGQLAGKALASRASAGIADLASQKAANVTRDATLKAAQDAGYVLPPAQVNPTLANRALEGLAGKLTTAQQASQKNQSVTNALIKSDLGIHPDAPLTLDTIRQVRADAAQAYAPIRQFGEVAADSDYANKLYDISTKYDLGHGGLKSLRNPEIENLISDATQLKMDSNTAVEMMRNLREQGFANKSPMASATQKKLGTAQLDISNAVEDLLDRSLQKAGQPEALQAFRDARVKIAKTFTAEKALNPSTGNIEASKLGAMFKKDKPLTGGMAQVGKAAAAFPAATKEITTSLPGMSPLDYLGGVGVGSMTGGLGFLAPFTRPIVRSGILSKGYQKAMVNAPKYESGLLTKMLADNPDDTRKLLGLLGGLSPAGAR